MKGCCAVSIVVETDMMGETMQDESGLVDAACRGDKEALQMLLKQNWGWLKGLVYSVLGSAQDLDDVMQDICLRVITRIHTLRDPQRVRAWLAVLARRVAIGHRRRGTQKAIPLDDVLVSELPAGYVDDPVEDIERKELCGRVLEVLGELPDKYREVFILAHTGELTYAQMAEVLEVPITTMQIRLVRARQMIRDRITGKSEHKVHEQ